MNLAYEIVSIYHSEAHAQRAQQEFVRVFQKGDIPDEMPVYHLQAGQSVLDVLSGSGLVSSGSAGRRMIDQNAVRLNGETLHDPTQEFPGAGVLQVGKRHFLKVIKP